MALAEVQLFVRKSFKDDNKMRINFELNILKAEMNSNYWRVGFNIFYFKPDAKSSSWSKSQLILLQVWIDHVPKRWSTLHFAEIFYLEMAVVFLLILYDKVIADDWNSLESLTKKSLWWATFLPNWNFYILFKYCLCGLLNLLSGLV